MLTERLSRGACGLRYDGCAEYDPKFAGAYWGASPQPQPQQPSALRLVTTAELPSFESRIL
jgi:hypothetical protein